MASKRPFTSRVAWLAAVGWAIALVGLVVSPRAAITAIACVLVAVLGSLVLLYGPLLLLGGGARFRSTRLGDLRLVAYVVLILSLFPLAVVPAVLLLVDILLPGADLVVAGLLASAVCVPFFLRTLIAQSICHWRVERLSRPGPDHLHAWVVRHRRAGVPPGHMIDGATRTLEGQFRRADLALDLLERHPVAADELSNDYQTWVARRIRAALQIGDAARAREIIARSSISDPGRDAAESLVLAIEGHGSEALGRLEALPTYFSLRGFESDVTRAHALASVGREAEAIAALAGANRPVDVRWPEGPATALLQRAIEHREHARSAERSQLPRLFWSDDGEQWSGEIVLASWAGFQPRRGDFTGRGEGAESDGCVRILFAATTAGRPPAVLPQVAAHAYLMEHEQGVSAAVLAAAFTDYPALRRSAIEKQPAMSRALPAVSKPAALKAVMGLGVVHVLPVEREGVAYVGFEFGCNWDEEHAYGVLMHKDRIVRTGEGEAAFTPEYAVEDGGCWIGESRA